MEKPDYLKTLVDNYRMPSPAVDLLRQHPPKIICGPTGAGKDTIARHMMQSGNYGHVVSTTSRESRSHRDGHEVNGVDYWFVTNRQVVEMLENHEFIEAALVHKRATVYGTSIAAYQTVIDNGKIPLLEIEVQGIMKLHRDVEDLNAIFLVPPSFEIWRERISGRGYMSDEDLHARFRSAIMEFDTADGHEFFIPVINNEVVDTVRAIQNGSYKKPQSIDMARRVINELRAKTQDLLNVA